MPNLLRRLAIDKKVAAYNFLNEYTKADEKAKGTKDDAKSGIAEDYVAHEIVMEEPKINADSDSEAAGGSFAEILEEKKKAEEPKIRPEILEEEKKILDEAEAVLENARKEAAEILEKAKARAEEIKEEEGKKGYDGGYNEGYAAGYGEAAAKVKETLGAESEELLNELKRVIEEAGRKKEELLKEYLTNLRDIAIAVGEKVIMVSLKSSGDIIEHMIIAATERLKTKEWAKVYISKADAEMMVEGGQDIINALSDISSHVRIIAMENENRGTCILEFPDEIIDASVGTQVENIKEILKNTGA